MFVRISVLRFIVVGFPVSKDKPLVIAYLLLITDSIASINEIRNKNTSLKTKIGTIT